MARGPSESAAPKVPPGLIRYRRNPTGEPLGDWYLAPAGARPPYSSDSAGPLFGSLPFGQ
jgi:hypothetical protein